MPSATGIVTEAWFHSETVDNPQMNQVNAALRLFATWFAELFAGQNAVIGNGFALSAVTGTPITFAVGSGWVVLQGEFFNLPSGNAPALANGDGTYHRYDIVAARFSSPAGTDSGGQPTASDTATVVVIPGSASATPALPPLLTTDVQLAWVDVPPGASTAAACTIHQVAAPLHALTLADLTNHVASALASGVHGATAAAPGASVPNQLLVGDPSHGAAGSALSLWDDTGAARVAGDPGNAGSQPNKVAVYDPSGRVYDTERLEGQIIGSGPNNIPQYDASGRVQDSEKVGGNSAGPLAGQVPVLDGNGAVQTANAGWDGTARRGFSQYNTGSHVATAIPTYNANGRVEDSERVAGLVPGSPGGMELNRPAVTDSTGNVGSSNRTSTVWKQRGTTSVGHTDSNGNFSWSVTFSPAMGQTPTVVCCAANGVSGNASTFESDSVTNTGCTIRGNYANTQGAFTQASYIADAN